MAYEHVSSGDQLDCMDEIFCKSFKKKHCTVEFTEER